MMYGEVVGLLNQVAGCDGLGAEAQVADGHTATLVGIVRKVGLVRREGGGNVGLDTLWNGDESASLK